MRCIVWFLPVLAVLPLAAGCGGATEEETTKTGQPDAEKPETGDLEILCGDSFIDPVTKLTEMYEEETGEKVDISQGGSEDLLPRVKLKRGGDVFITHTPYQQYTKDADALGREIPVGFLGPVLVVRKGNPKGVGNIEDLAREPGEGGDKLRVILPDPQYSTCGEMVFKLLEEKGITDAVLANVEDHLMRKHGQIGNQLKLDNRDAGIMWNGVANKFLDDIEVVPGPYEYDEIVVSVMGLSYSQRPNKLKKFLDFVEEHGEGVFKEFGYVK